MVGCTCCLVNWWADLGKGFKLETYEPINPQTEQAKDADSGDRRWACALDNRCYYCSGEKEEETKRLTNKFVHAKM